GFHVTGVQTCALPIYVNRTGANHRYYNVLDIWESSLLEGALMVRPILGNKKLTGVEQTDNDNITFTIYPNPAADQLMITSSEHRSEERRVGKETSSRR